MPAQAGAANNTRVCPKCHRQYEAGTTFCLEDGASLVEAASTILPTSAAVPSPPVGATNPYFPPSGDPVVEGAQVGEYVVGRKIGEGGMGVIYAAMHPIIGKRVAIKVLNADMAANPVIVQRFIQEAKSVNQIGHRNIVDIFSFGRLSDGRHYFAMEFLEGRSLASRLAAEDPLAWDEAIQIWQQASSAIEAAHREGIVHRDLKPDNVFVTPSDDGPFVKVLDFGIAKLLGDANQGLHKTGTGVPIGTPAYMSPEQASGSGVDHRTDVYAFGIILYECIAGRSPFAHHQSFIALLTAHLSEAPPPLTQWVDVNPELDRFVMRMLSKNPEERPQSMTEVRQELARLRDLAVQLRRPLYARTGDLAKETLGAMTAQPEAGPLTRRIDRVEAAQMGAGSPATAEPQAAARKGPGAVWVAIAAAVLLVGGAAAWRFGGDSKAAAPPPAVAVAAPVPSPTPPPVVAPAPPAGPQVARVEVLTTVATARLFIDEGVAERSEKPAAEGGTELAAEVPVNEAFLLRVEAEGYKKFETALKVPAGETKQISVTLEPLAKPSSGWRSSPSGGRVKGPGQPTAAPSGSANPNLINPF